MQSIHFVTDNSSDLTSHPAEVTFVHNIPGGLGCVSIGGYPPPDMYIYLDDVDITSRFVSLQSASLVGEFGLRQMIYRTEKWADQLVFSADDDASHMKCVTIVSDIGSTSVSVKIGVNCESFFVNKHRHST